MKAAPPLRRGKRPRHRAPCLSLSAKQHSELAPDSLMRIKFRRDALRQDDLRGAGNGRSRVLILYALAWQQDAAVGVRLM
jgi:hypothetical protein